MNSTGKIARFGLAVCFTAGVAGSAMAATVTLAWDPVPEGGVTYVVQYGTQPGQHPSSVGCGAQTVCSISVPNNQTYYFVVRAQNAAGQSPPSSEAAARVGNGSVILGIWPTTASFGPDGGPAGITYVSGTELAAASLSPWLRVASGLTITGNGTLAYSVTPNPAPNLRNGAVNVGGIIVPVSQSPGPASNWKTPQLLMPKDYDGDGRADIAVFRDSTGEWFARGSSDGYQYASFGAPTLVDDIPAPADFDGDGKADYAVFRNTTGEWFIRESSTGGVLSLPWGSPLYLDLPVPADFDGDGKSDIGVYRRSTGEWFILRSSDGQLSYNTWGSPADGDIPVPTDYDGDGKTDVGVYRPATSQWFIMQSGGGGTLTVPWGSLAQGDIPVPGDYDGDGNADIAVYRNLTGQWFIRRSGNGGSLRTETWGSFAAADSPVPADYDGDGITDIAVYRGGTGQWFLLFSGGGPIESVGWGAPSLFDIVRGR